MVGYSFFSLPVHISDSPPIQESKYDRGDAEPRKTNNPPDSAQQPQKSAIPVFRNDVEDHPKNPGAPNNPADLIATARRDLGEAYGLGRPLRRTELARLIGLSDGHGDDHLARLEKGTAVLSGPVEVVLRMLLEGHASPLHKRALKSRYTARGRTRRRQKRP
jgi:hypothetical protein